MKLKSVLIVQENRLYLSPAIRANTLGSSAHDELGAVKSARTTTRKTCYKAVTKFKE